MKALSIRQPWAWAIIHAGKDIENRNWSTKFRGRFLVHASQGMTRNEYGDFADFMRVGPFPRMPALPAFEQLARGGIVGSIDLIDCVKDDHDSPWFFGPYGFVLANAEPLPFTPLKGKLGFFDVEMLEDAR